jgi:excisionase family DNA binding protein
MSETILHNPPVPAQLPEVHLCKKELAHLLNRGVRTIEAWMHDEQIPYYKTGKRVSFIYSEVEGAMRSWRVSQHQNNPPGKNYVN